MFERQASKVAPLLLAKHKWECSSILNFCRGSATYPAWADRTSSTGLGEG
jgi:hypothetical protein